MLDAERMGWEVKRRKAEENRMVVWRVDIVFLSASWIVRIARMLYCNRLPPLKTLILGSCLLSP